MSEAEGAADGDGDRDDGRDVRRDADDGRDIRVDGDADDDGAPEAEDEGPDADVDAEVPEVDDVPDVPEVEEDGEAGPEEYEEEDGGAEAEFEGEGEAGPEEDGEADVPGDDPGEGDAEEGAEAPDAPLCGNGSLDPGEECDGDAPRVCTTTCDTAGTQACVDCRWSAECVPPLEACGGGDDDCDTECDEGFGCCAGSTGDCTTTCLSTGSRTCSPACAWGSCTAPAETCNGADDDCDTFCDEPGACCAGDAEPCSTSCLTTGTRTCGATCAWGSCVPPEDICNGADDDCDTTCDEPDACCAGESGSCETSCRTTGTHVCSGACTWGPCLAPSESCNGIDDDCDTTCDEGFGCCVGTTTSCTTGCSTPGTHLCSAGCAYGDCCAAAEVCGNDCDDDCDTLRDEGCAACPPCVGAVDISGGGRFTGVVSAGASTTSGSCGGSGAEALFTFMTSGVKDVFLTTHASSFDTVLYVRSCNCTGTEVLCNDDADGRNTSLLVLRDLAAGRYNVFVDAKSAGGGGAFQLDAYVTDPGPTGDRCGDPIRITGAGDTKNTCLFSTDYSPYHVTGCMGDTGAGEDVVYYFVLAAPTTVRFQTCTSNVYCPDAGCADTGLYIRDICTSMTPQRVCIDDGCGYRYTGYRIHSDTEPVDLPAGIYYLVLDGYGVPGDIWYNCGNVNLVVTGL